MKDIAIVIPGMNTGDYVKNALQSLARTEWRAYTHEIIYVDNGSTDDTLALVREQFPHVRIIANPKNLGFCIAANQGAAAANARYILHLNNDTIVYPESVPLLAEFLDHKREAAVVGARLLNPDLTDQWSARRFPSWFHGCLGRRSHLARWFPNAQVVRDYLYKDQLGSNGPFPVDWVPTPCMMVRRDLFQRLGGFPEDFYYWHEATFCDRVGKMGWQIWLEPRSRVIHFEGQGGGPRSYDVRRWHIIDFHLGAYRFYCEHYGLGPLTAARWVAVLGLATRALILLTANRLASLGEKA